MDTSDIVFFTMFYLIIGLIVNFAQRAINEEEVPFGDDSLGIMLFWPLFVFKGVALSFLYVFAFLPRSIVAAGKTLVGK